MASYPLDSVHINCLALPVLCDMPFSDIYLHELCLKFFSYTHVYV